MFYKTIAMNICTPVYNFFIIQHPVKMFGIRMGSSLTILILNIFMGRTRRAATLDAQSPECAAFGTLRC